LQDASCSATASDRFLLGALVVATIVIGIIPAVLPVIP
jgi:hypothetical protein